MLLFRKSLRISHWFDLLLLLLVHCGQVHATLLLDEPFDYPDGPLVGVTGSTWIHHSPTSGHIGEIRVISGQALVAFTNSEDASVLIPGGPYLPFPDTNLYASFTVNFRVLPSGSGSYFVHFKDSDLGYRGRLWAFTDGAPSGDLRLGLSSASASPMSVTNPTVLSLGSGYTIVLKVSTKTGATTLWINPTNETDASVTTSEESSGFSATAFALRETSGIGVVELDDLRLGTTFTDVHGKTSPPPPPPSSTTPGFSIVTYNVDGNGVADWSTNSAQVQAIGRQMEFLDPDIITFQEIPFTNTWQMGNFVAAFLPDYSLATNSGTDGFIRSAILSRFPIIRSTKWLDGVRLDDFGFAGRFTRDLFEAVIQVPGLSQPLHVFTTHLKAGQDSDSVARRAAEARAISNYFATIYLATNALQPYLLTGDLNEDVARPSSGSGQPIESLANAATGLRLVTPVNPSSQSELTYSSRAENLSRRYDYILPCALLSTNKSFGEVFRTDQATNLSPALTNDSEVASDHLPVQMEFFNPYATPFSILGFSISNSQIQCRWQSVPGGHYQIDSSSDGSHWAPLATNIEAQTSDTTFSAKAPFEAQIYRVEVVP